MLIGIGTKGIQSSAYILEPIINREASSYIIENYRNLIGIVRSCDVKEEKANDLLHDVYISIVDAEENGEGFDMEYGSRVNEDGEIEANLMSVEQFVIGRIKLYAKNNKYRTDVIEATNGTVNEVHTYYDTEMDEHGHEVLNKDGTPKLVKRVERRKVNILMTANAASFNEGGDVADNNDDFQKAFATAAVADSTDDITEMMSLREQIDYCIDVCSLHDVNILNVFKNIDALADMLGDYSKKKKTAESVFSKLSELVEYHTELGTNLIEILRYSAKNRSVFEAIIATY